MIGRVKLIFLEKVPYFGQDNFQRILCPSVNYFNFTPFYNGFLSADEFCETFA